MVDRQVGSKSKNVLLILRAEYIAHTLALNCEVPTYGREAMEHDEIA